MALLNDAGTYVTTGGLWSDVFTYDTRSNLISHVDARGVETNFNYNNDPLNRLQSISWDTTGFGDTANPIVPAPTISYTYMTAGDRTRVDKVTTTSVSTKDYSYDTEGRVSSVSMTLTTRAAFPQVTDYTHDSLNRVTDMRYPAEYGNGTQPRKLVHQDFDVASRLSGLKLDGVSQASSIVYNPASQATSLKVGTGTNQITESYAYEALTGLLSNQKVQRGTTTLLDLSYDYLRAGTTAGRTGQLTDIGNNLDHGRDRAYEYDALGRLKKATGGSTPSWTQTYGYDRYGNRTTVTATGAADDGSPIPRDGLASVVYGATTNRITTSGWQYDAAGNQVRGLIPGSTTTWQKYQYDAAGRLVNVKTDAGAVIASYTYGDSNERLITNEAGYRTYYCSAGGTVIAEYSETPSLPTTPKWSKSYLYLGGRLLSTLSPNGSGGAAINYHHPDRLGTRLVTDPSNGTHFEQVSLPYGTALNAESTGATNQRFTSYDRSATTKLDYAVNRHYDPQQGRFTQTDPIGMGAANLGDPQSLNSYSYTQNDPVNFADPTGLMRNICLDSDGMPVRCPDGGTWIVNVYVSWADRIIDGYGADRGLNNGLSMRPFIGGGGGGGTTPQNTTPLSNAEINHLKGDLEGVLKGKCLDFVKAVLKKLNSPTDDLMKVFGKVTEFDRKVMAASASVGGTLGRIDAGTRKGLSITINYSLGDEAYGRNMSGRVMIHELIHAATASTANQVFHYQMDQAAWDVAEAMGLKNIGKRPEFTPSKTTLDTRTADFFERKLFDFCRVQN